MIKSIYLSIFTVFLFFVFAAAVAGTSKEVRQQQKAAQKERQVLKKTRTDNYRSAQKEFREFTKIIKKDYREQTAELKIDFDLKNADLQADHEARVAEATAENEKKTMNLIVNSKFNFDQAAMEQLQKDAKVYSDELFALRKQLAEQIHGEQIAFEKRKNKLFEERDQEALDKAAGLGMTKSFSPIIASPIGGTLSKSEERWNEIEKKEVKKLEDKNHKMLGEYRNGNKLREWELQKKNDDFKLAWEEKSELHKLEAEALFFNTIMMQALQGGEINQQELIDKTSEINKQKKLIRIDYKKKREKNRIKRNKQRKDILKN